ncbi:ciliary microtubule inner protein 6-like isoform X2 [Brachyhypopomus gauderio]|uniref:ciliary microtubule inner protein 6-like isoform X2 n=1 Tax=Brachyhypopomus gauderio TaxID=698409 RepID=UPI0040420C59
MYPRAEISLPRKKRVRESYRSNTYRIFDEKVPDRLNPDQFYRDHKYETRDRRETELLKTHNIPQPYNARFIRTNVRFLNEPVAYMETEDTMAEQFKWWSAVPVKELHRKTVYSKDSTQRRDYQPITNTTVTRVLEGRDRPPATGIVPTLNLPGQPVDLEEHMSFIHQYDSRRVHDQPYQGRVRACFVMEPLCGVRGGQGGPSHSRARRGLVRPLRGERTG